MEVGRFGKIECAFKRMKEGKIMSEKLIINEFQTANKIIFGNGSILRLNQEKIVKRANKICLITDKGLEKVGVLENFIPLLSDKEVITYTDIEGEPTFQLVCNAINKIEKEN